jgi:predicted acetyltransferase
MNLVLRELTEQDESAFFDGMKEWIGESAHWYSFAWKEGMTYQEMLKILKDERNGVNLRPNRVPHTMLYGFVENKIIGRLSVRHILNDHLKYRGGHIGYAVGPSFRRKGFATEMVRQGLGYCKSLGITSVMVTCADDNEPSWKIVEKFNGKLEDKVWDYEDNELIRRYWIQL